MKMIEKRWFSGMRNSSTVSLRRKILIMTPSAKFSSPIIETRGRKERSGSDAIQSAAHYSGEIHPLSFHFCHRHHVRPFSLDDLARKGAHGKRHNPRRDRPCRVTGHL